LPAIRRRLSVTDNDTEHVYTLAIPNLFSFYVKNALQYTFVRHERNDDTNEKSIREYFPRFPSILFAIFSLRHTIGFTNVTKVEEVCKSKIHTELHIRLKKNDSGHHGWEKDQ
jgi:hypothetical protein